MEKAQKVGDSFQVRQEIKKAIKHKLPLKLHCQQGKSYLIHPFYLFHWEQRPYVMGEVYEKHCFNLFAVSEIKQAQLMLEIREPQYGPEEAEDFMSHLKLIQNNDVRLILKVPCLHSQLESDEHYFSRIFQTHNTKGSTIWAANVEPCQELFQWLESLGGQVEILAPSSFKQEFDHYRQKHALAS